MTAHENGLDLELVSVLLDWESIRPSSALATRKAGNARAAFTIHVDPVEGGCFEAVGLINDEPFGQAARAGVRVDETVDFAVLGVVDGEGDRLARPFLMPATARCASMATERAILRR